MNNTSPPNPINEKTNRVLEALRREYVIVGKTRVRGWQAWLLIGVVTGIVSGIVFVANRSGEFAETGATVTETAVKEYVFKFYIEPALIPDREFAKRALVQYVEDMNAILAKNTNVRLSFDPETGIAATNLPIQRFSLSTCDSPTDFEIWVNVISSKTAQNVLGFGSGAVICPQDYNNVLVANFLVWDRVYDPTALGVDVISDVRGYWQQIGIMLHEIAHMSGAGIGEYYSLRRVTDPTGEEPRLGISSSDPSDPYWSERREYLSDPLLNTDLYNSPVLGRPTTGSALLNAMRFSRLTAAFFNAHGRYNSNRMARMATIPDLTKVRMRVLEKDTAIPIANAKVKIWDIPTIPNRRDLSPRVLVEAATNESGELIWDWWKGFDPTYYLRLIKVYKDGLIPSVKYVSRIDAQEAKVLRGEDELLVIVYMDDKQSLSLLSPNGGEAWEAGSRQTVRWSGNTPESENVRVSLQLVLPDGIVKSSSGLPENTKNDGIEYWTVPGGIDPGRYRLRVQCVNNCAVLKNQSDESDDLFTLTGLPPTFPALTVLGIAGGEKWQPGSTQHIQWRTNNISLPSQIEVIRLKDQSRPDVGYTLASNVSNIYGYGVTPVVIPPTVPPGRYLVEIQTHVGTQIVSDISDALVIIGGIVLSSIGDKSVQAGEELSFIVSAVSGGSGVVNFSTAPSLSGMRLLPLGDVTMNGSVSSLDGARILQYLAGGRTLTPSQKLLADANLDGTVDQKDAKFALSIATGVSQPKRAVVFVWKPSTEQARPHTITFVASEDAINDKATETIRINVIPPPPPPPPPPTISLAVLSPNGGEVWPILSTQTIRWSGVTPDSADVRVSLDLLGQYGSLPLFSDLPKNIANDGSESWTVPEYIEAGEHRIQIRCVRNCAVFAGQSDQSDATFRITAP